MSVITQRVSGVLVALFMVGATVETSQADEDDQMSKDIEAWMLSMGASTVLHWKSVADRTSLLVSLAEPTKVIVCSQSRGSWAGGSYYVYDRRGYDRRQYQLRFFYRVLLLLGHNSRERAA